MIKPFQFALLFALCLAAIAFGQKSKTPTERSVAGIVTDSTGSPVPGAVVQLENMKTLEIRSYIATEKGDYRFNGLGTDVDYQLKAQSNGKSSATKTLSSFDSHPAAVINLQLK